MTETSFFWTTNDTGDGVAAGYSQAAMFNIFRGLFAKSSSAGGVSPDYANELAVSGASSPVAVATGAAVVYGIPYVNDAQVNVAIPTPTTSTRIDRIVLRASWAAQTVRVTRIAGSEGGAAPSLTQSAGTTWDIPLAQVSITTGGVITVTDERQWLSVVGDGDVTTAKIADGAVTTGKIANDAVTQDKIAAASVGATELASDSVTADKIATGAVGASELASNAVEAGKIAAGAVTQAKLGTDTLREYRIPLVMPTLYHDASVTTYDISNAFFPMQKRVNADVLPAGATVKFRALLGVKSPDGGTGYAVLRNWTDGVTISASEVSSATNIGTNVFAGSWVTSGDIRSSLAAGEKAYQVMLKHSVGGAGGARIVYAELLVEW